MSRLAKTSPEKAPSQRTRTAGRRDYDQLLSRRLEQLNTAMDSNAEPEIVPVVERTPTTITATNLTFGIRAIVITALLSSLGGAGIMLLVKDKLTPTPEQAVLATNAPRPVAAPPIAAPAQASPAPSPVPLPVNTSEASARVLIEQWRSAWINRDSNTYLSFYSTDFVPTDGSTRTNWATARRKNLASHPDINVSIHDLQITQIDDKQLKLLFLQDYVSGSYRESAKTKTLILALEGDVWRITGEWMGNHPVTSK